MEEEEKKETTATMGVRETEFIGDVEVVSVQENKYEYKRTPRAAIGLEKRREEESDDDDDVYVSKKSSESHKPSGGKEGEGEGELHVAGEEEGAAVTTNGKQNGVAEASPPAVAPKSGGEVATYIRLAEKEAEEDKTTPKRRRRRWRKKTPVETYPQQAFHFLGRYRAVKSTPPCFGCTRR